MITFTEKGSWTDHDPFIGQTYVPNFMVKDGVKYFVMNRVVRGGSPDDSDLEEIKTFFIQNGGRYFKLYGMYADPFEMVKEMAEREHTFCEPEKLFDDCRGTSGYGAGFVDFGGNRNEAAAAFQYRIYDPVMVLALQEAVKPIIGKERGGWHGQNPIHTEVILCPAGQLL